jgi:hypothetical protein
MSEGPAELSPAPEGDYDDANSEATSEEESQRDADFNSFLSQEQSDITSTTLSMSSLDADMFRSSELDASQNRAVNNPGIAVGDGGNNDVANMDQNLNRVMNNIANDPTARQQWNTQRFIAIFAGLSGVAATVAVVYQIIKDALAGKDDSDVPIPDEAKKKVRDLVKKWWAQADEDYWKAMAVAADNPDLSLTIADQILFMNYTINLSPIVPWIWQSSADLVSVVNQCETAYATAGSKTSAMYLLAPALKDPHPNPPQPTILPRAVAATVLRYALTNILIDPNKPPAT